jgi:predicted amidohydrolase
MKTGFIQFSPLLGQAQATIQRLDALLDEARDADLIVLPELCNSGYNFEHKAMAASLAEEVSDSPFIRFLEAKAKAHQQYIVSGFHEKAGDALYNSSVLIGPRGWMGTYRKLHLFWNEKDIFEPGNLGLPVFQLDNGLTLGMLVCFDWMFPEAWRSLSLKGAQIVCHPSNLVLPGFAQKAVPIHALINRYFVVTANRIGAEKELTFTGMSTMANPKGEVIFQAEAAEESVYFTDIVPEQADNKWITPRNHALDDRRPDCYDLG